MWSAGWQRDGLLEASSMSKQDCKVFIGGLSWETNDEKLRRYFENYGAVHEAFVSYDRNTGRPRGFGFVVFDDPAVADKVVSLQHTVDRREVNPGQIVPGAHIIGRLEARGLTPHLNCVGGGKEGRSQGRAGRSQAPERHLLLPHQEDFCWGPGPHSGRGALPHVL